MRLRQLVLAARDIERVEADFAAVFGWQVAYRDPVVGKWGLRNCVIPVGNEFIEVVSPTQEGTSAGRHLSRMGGDGGYMVMFQVADRAAHTARLQAAGVRVAYRSDQATYCLTQFHPADCGGLILSWEQILHPAGADWRVPDGYWHAADGERWRDHVVTTRVGSIQRLVLGGPSASGLATTYAALLDRPINQAGDIPEIDLPGIALGFVDRTEPGAMERIEIEAHAPEDVLAAARGRGIPVNGNELKIAGIWFRLV